MSRLSELLEQARSALAELSSCLAPGIPEDPNIDTYPSDAQLARHYLRLRRQRESRFPADLFADPAWDILLDLYAAELEGATVSVSSACIASAVPQTTALRWLERLYRSGMIIRKADPVDARRFHVHLTAEARSEISKWLHGAFRGNRPSKPA